MKRQRASVFPLLFAGSSRVHCLLLKVDLASKLSSWPSDDHLEAAVSATAFHLADSRETEDIGPDSHICLLFLHTQLQCYF